MKVNKKQNSVPNRRNNGMVSQPRKRTRVRDASRNNNSQIGVAAAYSTGNFGKSPQVNASFDSCRVVHRELVGNVSGLNNAGAFVLANTFALNPGLSATFPWLSNMAGNWETYHFNKLRFCYYTRCGTGTSGSVILAPDYDAADASPITEQNASSYIDIREDAPYKDITCILRPAAMHPMGPKKFIRNAALAANQDIKTYDVGNLFVCTVDSSAAASWGKLWVEYDITLFTPQIQALGGSGFANQFTLSAAGGGIAAASIFGATPEEMGGIDVSTALNVITINSGLIIGQEYAISCSITGTVISVFGLAAVTGLTSKTICFTGFPAAATSGNFSRTFIATAVSGSITVNCTATSVTASQTVFSLIPTAAF
jgi:hypothetical protein